MVLQRTAAWWFAVILLFVTFAGCRKKEQVQLLGGAQAFDWSETAGVCTLKTTGNCTKGPSGNYCAKDSTCNVALKINGNQVDLYLNGQLQALTGSKIVCVEQGTAITWSVSNPPTNASFLADFGNAAAFSDNQFLTYFTGTAGQAITRTVANADGCYKYNIKVCPVPATVGPTPLGCGESDPVVIVGSGS